MHGLDLEVENELLYLKPLIRDWVQRAGAEMKESIQEQWLHGRDSW